MLGQRNAAMSGSVLAVPELHASNSTTVIASISTRSKVESCLISRPLREHRSAVMAASASRVPSADDEVEHGTDRLHEEYE